MADIQPFTPTSPDSSLPSSRRPSGHSVRRSSLPVLPPVPLSSSYRHRPSVSSIATSASSATNNTDDPLVAEHTDLAMYRDMQSYVFGGASSSAHTFAGAPPSALRHVRQRMPSEDDHEDNSDVGSAYSPEDDTGVFVGSQSRWERSAALAENDRMDVDLDRKLSRDLTPSVKGEKKRERNGHNRAAGSGSTVRYDDEPLADEDDSARILERAKMRAIDDGTRRPSLPFNVQPTSPMSITFSESAFMPPAPLSPTTPTATSFALPPPAALPLLSERPLKSRPRSRSNRAQKALPYLPSNAGVSPDWIAPWSASSSETGRSASTSPPSANVALGLAPPGTNPFLNPTRTGNGNPFMVARERTMEEPVQTIVTHASPSPPPEVPENGATADFDLAFILSPSSSHPNPLPPRKASLAPSFEDSFARFVNKFDEEYGERRDKWSYRIERPALDSSGDYWRCENMGKYWVGRGPGEGVVDDSNEGHGSGDNSILIRYCPKEKEGVASSSTDGRKKQMFNFSAGPLSVFTGGGDVQPGPMSPVMTPSQRRSNIRVQVKKHTRAPAFTLYLGPRAPRSLASSRPSVLLAPKAYHLHTSGPPKGQSRTPPTKGKDKEEVFPPPRSSSLNIRGGKEGYEMQPLGRSASPPSPPSVSLDFMSVAAATGRMTSSHNQAFDTLSPEDGQAVLEHLKHRSSLGIRLKRAFGGMNSSPKDAPSSTTSAQSHSSDSTDEKKDSGHGPLEAAYEPPWMLMTPMYVKEAVIAAERSMYTGFASLGLAVPQNRKNKRLITPPEVVEAMRRNSVLDTVPNEAMCMVLPLWDLTLDLERRRPVVDDLDIDLDDLEEEDEEEEDAVDEMLDEGKEERKKLVKEMARRRKLMPPPKMERKYLLAYYIPFTVKRQSMVATPTAVAEAQRSTKKQRTRQQAATSSRGSLSRRNSGGAGVTLATTKPASAPVRSFRVVSRILTQAELRDSGLNPPRNIVDPKRMQQQSMSTPSSYYHSSLNYQRMDRRLSSASILGDNVPSSFSAVIAMCHDRRKGVEFIPEGLDSLGLCGGETVVGPNGTIEKMPPLFPPAHMVPVSERRTPPLNAVGRQIVEMIWAGCLALTELGI